MPGLTRCQWAASGALGPLDSDGGSESAGACRGGTPPACAARARPMTREGRPTGFALANFKLRPREHDARIYGSRASQYLEAAMVASGCMVSTCAPRAHLGGGSLFSS